MSRNGVVELSYPAEPNASLENPGVPFFRPQGK